MENQVRRKVANINSYSSYIDGVWRVFLLYSISDSNVHGLIDMRPSIPIFVRIKKNSSLPKSAFWIKCPMYETYSVLHGPAGSPFRLQLCTVFGINSILLYSFFFKHSLDWRWRLSGLQNADVHFRQSLKWLANKQVMIKKLVLQHCCIRTNDPIQHHPRRHT